ncbi:hypothetical protein EGU81_29470 [Pseudomonas syringae pv. theae]|nr:hypothetical protein [Pseudomonas syringae pv. theae]
MLVFVFVFVFVSSPRILGAQRPSKLLYYRDATYCQALGDRETDTAITTHLEPITSAISPERSIVN